MDNCNLLTFISAFTIIIAENKDSIIWYPIPLNMDPKNQAQPSQFLQYLYGLQNQPVPTDKVQERSGNLQEVKTQCNHHVQTNPQRNLYIPNQYLSYGQNTGSYLMNLEQLKMLNLNQRQGFYKNPIRYVVGQNSEDIATPLYYFNMFGQALNSAADIRSGKDEAIVQKNGTAVRAEADTNQTLSTTENSITKEAATSLRDNFSSTFEVQYDKKTDKDVGARVFTDLSKSTAVPIYTSDYSSIRLNNGITSRKFKDAKSSANNTKHSKPEPENEDTQTIELEIMGVKEESSIHPNVEVIDYTTQSSLSSTNADYLENDNRKANDEYSSTDLEEVESNDSDTISSTVVPKKNGSKSSTNTESKNTEDYNNTKPPKNSDGQDITSNPIANDTNSETKNTKTQQDGGIGEAKDDTQSVTDSKAKENSNTQSSNNPEDRDVKISNPEPEDSTDVNNSSTDTEEEKLKTRLNKTITECLPAHIKIKDDKIEDQSKMETSSTTVKNTDLIKKDILCQSDDLSESESTEDSSLYDPTKSDELKEITGSKNKNNRHPSLSVLIETYLKTASATDTVETDTVETELFDQLDKNTCKCLHTLMETILKNLIQKRTSSEIISTQA